MRTEEGTYRQTREQAEEQAKSAFRDHVITAEGPGRWRCAKPGTWIYGFRVITAPGAVIVTGDIYEAVFCMYDSDPLPWIVSVGKHRQFDYLLEKMRAGPEPCFYKGDADEYLAERLKYDDEEYPTADGEEPRTTVARKAAEEIRQLASWDELDYSSWGRAWSDAGADEIHGCDYPSHQAVFICEALAWFANHVEDVPYYVQEAA